MATVIRRQPKPGRTILAGAVGWRRGGTPQRRRRHHPHPRRMGRRPAPSSRPSSRGSRSSPGRGWTPLRRRCSTGSGEPLWQAARRRRQRRRLPLLQRPTRHPDRRDVRLSGLKGAERARLDGADSRLKQRICFLPSPTAGASSRSLALGLTCMALGSTTSMT